MQKLINLIESGDCWDLLDLLPCGVSIAMDISCKAILHNKLAGKFLRVGMRDNFSHSSDEPPPVKFFHHRKELTAAEMPIQQAAWNKETIINYEMELVWPDGIRQITLWNAQPLYKNGVVNGAIAIWEDITNRKQYEKRLQESEEKFRMAITHAPVPVMLHAEDGEVLLINNCWTEKTGYTIEDIPTMQTWTDKALGKRQNQSNAIYEQSSPSFEAVYSITTKCGETQIWSLWSGPIGKLPDGRRIAVSKAMDITELKMAEAALQQNARELQEINAALEEEIVERQTAQKALAISEARYRGIVNNMQDLFSYYRVILDENDRPVDLEIIANNPAWEQYIGLNNSEIIDKRYTEIFPGIGTWSINWIEKLGKVALEGQPVTAELYFGHANRWFRTSIYSPQKNEVAVISEDITERKKQEKQLKNYAKELAATNEQLVETNKELKSFANSVAHDFRSPMVNLKGFSEELGYSLSELQQIIQEEELHLPEKVQKKVTDLLCKDVPDAQKFISSAVDRLSRMVDAMLKLARLGRREMIRTEVDMNELVRTILQSYNHQIEEKNIQLRIGYLPKITTDHMAIEQIISNLIDNAIKYLRPDQPATIGISFLDTGKEYFFSVEDNGRGITAEDMDKIFEIFRRAGKQDVPGEGMGLAYVRALVRQLGGKVWCESEVGSGTKFNFTLPKYDPNMLNLSF